MKIKKKILIILLAFSIITIVATSTVTAADPPERIYVNESFNFTYHSFDSAPGKANYFSSINAYDDAFYFTMGQQNKMIEYSPVYNQMIQVGDQKENGQSVDINNIFGQKVGSISSDSNGVFSFSVQIDKPFSFTWSGGHKVGLNDDAKQIEEIYDADGKLIYKK